MEFRILGPLEVLVGHRRIALGTPQAKALLAVLLVHADRVVSIQQLADELWPADRGAEEARATIHTYVSRLRRMLRDTEQVDGTGTGGRLVTSRPGYLLRVEQGELDLHRFDELVTKARAARQAGELAAAVDLLREAQLMWRGEPFEDVLATPTLTAEASRLTEYRLGTLEELLDAELEFGKSGELVAELTALVERFPLRERFRALLMLAFYRAGRQAEALRAFQQAREVLVEELGIEPGPELRELHQRILRGEPTLAAPTRTTTAPLERVRAELRLDKAVGELATAVTDQWTAEVELRGLQRPEPVRVRWASTGRPVAAAPARVVLGGTERPRLDLRGELTDLVREFRRVPARQLVVLGEPGAGKTVLAILLTLGLLGNPAPDEPIPVLLPLSSWNPQQEHLHTWLERKLVEEYPGLANTAAYGPDVVTRLVTEGRVMPVLDGLDETPPGLHAAAIESLDQAIAGGRPLVVTCRTSEYENAVLKGGAILASAAVVEIAPVRLGDAIAFLTARRRIGDDRWSPVVEHLESHPEGPLATALSTPLMVDLARAAYRHPGTDPAELCDPVRFADAAEIEQHLLDTFLLAAYARHPVPPASRRAARPRRYEPEQAQRWLTFLARHLQHAGTRDLAWWQLTDAIPAFTRGLVFGLLPALVFATTGLLVAGPRFAVIYGVSLALAGCVTHALGKRPGPLRVEPRLRGTGTRFVIRFAIGLVIGIVLGLDWTLPLHLDLALALVFGFALGAHVWLDTPADATQAASPTVVLRQERTAALLFTISFALSLGLFYGMASAFTDDTRFLPVLGDHFDLGIALAGGLASALLGHFLFGRLGSLAYGFAGAAVVGGQGLQGSATSTTALLAGIAFGVAIGLTVALSRAWGAFLLGRIWLALRGRTPLRLMRFLEDAHQRGVLRQAGAVYQFRHARLQDRLAGKARSRSLA